MLYYDNTIEVVLDRKQMWPKGDKVGKISSSRWIIAKQKLIFEPDLAYLLYRNALIRTMA